ncbi:MAG: GerW family sporulation protein [Solirubrobacterales bacterium]
MLKDNLESLFSHLGDILSSKTVVGEPIQSGGITVIPLISSKFGFGTGGGEGSDEKHGKGVGAGAGAGASIKPVGMIVIQGEEVRLYTMGEKGALEKLTEMIPGLVSKFKAKEETA